MDFLKGLLKCFHSMCVHVRHRAGRRSFVSLYAISYLGVINLLHKNTNTTNIHNCYSEIIYYPISQSAECSFNLILITEHVIYLNI